MKQIKFFAVALAALTMFSCSKENVDNPDNNTPGEPATLTINLVGNSTKAVGDPGNTSDVTIKDGIIFLFKSDGSFDVPATDFTGLTKKVKATTAAKKLYIVANVGAFATSPLKNVKNETDLIAATGDLFAADASTQTKDNLWMSGKEDLSFTPGVTEISSTVTLNFVSARIDVIIKDERTNNIVGAGKISIADDNVALLFAGSKGSFFGNNTAKVTQSAFYSGFATTTTTNTTVKAALSGVAGTFNNTVKHHFYTFGNDGKVVMPTILTIKSTRTNANASTSSIYYPIQLIESELGTGNHLTPGIKYTITLTLKGDVGNGGGGGTPDPEVPIVSADINVTITAAKWNAKIVGKEFN